MILGYPKILSLSKKNLKSIQDIFQDKDLYQTSEEQDNDLVRNFQNIDLKPIPYTSFKYQSLLKVRNLEPFQDEQPEYLLELAHGYVKKGQQPK